MKCKKENLIKVIAETHKNIIPYFQGITNIHEGYLYFISYDSKFTINDSYLLHHRVLKISHLYPKPSGTTITQRSTNL